MAKVSHTQRKNTPPPAHQVDKMGAIKEYFDTPEVKASFEAVLGKRALGYIVGILQIIWKDEQLKLADLQSLFNASIRAAMLGLSLDNSLQHAHILPWTDKNTGKVYAQFQVGWRGLVELCQRTDKYETINVNDVREGEYEGKDMLTGEYSWKWNQDVTARNASRLIGFVSYFKLLSGFKKTVYWTVEELNEHAAKYSESFNRKDGSWFIDFPSMAKKTVLKDNLSKWGPKSTELATALEIDQAIITGTEGKIEYLDNPTNGDTKELNNRKKKADDGLNALKAKLKKK
jgi:recombination protein RecT